MNFGKEFPIVLLAFALGCSRSGLDVVGAGPLASGNDATVGGGGQDAASSESGAAPMIESGARDAAGCNYNDPTRRYVGRGDCAAIDWGCKTGVPFQNSCGCGCVLSNGGSSSSSGGSASGPSGNSSGSSSVSPSCAPGGNGLTNCGANSESCCTSLEVTGGTYYRTYTNDGGGPAAEADEATVSGFRLDKYLGTVGRYRHFVSAWNGGWTPPAGSGKHTHLNGGSGLNATGGGYEPGWVTSDNRNIAPTGAGDTTCAPYSTWTTSAGSNENLPMNCVNWYEAYAFCIWDGGFLPSEAEWEYAAAGGSQQREYPWGTAAPGTASQYAIYGCYYPSGSATCARVTNIAPVGTATLGAGLWGQLDLAGSVAEWNVDWFATPYLRPCGDCANLTAASDRVVRGSSFDFPYLLSLLPPSRANSPPQSHYSGVGFRCARTP